MTNISEIYREKFPIIADIIIHDKAKYEHIVNEVIRGANDMVKSIGYQGSESEGDGVGIKCGHYTLHEEQIVLQAREDFDTFIMEKPRDNNKTYITSLTSALFFYMEYPDEIGRPMYEVVKTFYDMHGEPTEEVLEEAEEVYRLKHNLPKIKVTL